MENSDKQPKVAVYCRVGSKEQLGADKDFDTQQKIAMRARQEKELFGSLGYYVDGYLSRDKNETNRARFMQTLEEIKTEILDNIDNAPAILYERKKRGEINDLRLRFTKGEEDNFSEIDVHATNIIIMALQDSKPFTQDK